MYARVRKEYTDAVNFAGAVYERNNATLRDISARLGIPYWNLQKRAVRLLKRTNHLIGVEKRGTKNVYFQKQPGLTPHKARQLQKQKTPRKFQ